MGQAPSLSGRPANSITLAPRPAKALKALGYKIVLVNSNPATIMTDPGMADATYIEPLNVDRLAQIIEKERPDALLPNLAGKTGST